MCVRQCVTSLVSDRSWSDSAQGKATGAVLGDWLNTTFIQETSGVAAVIARAVEAARDPEVVVFANAGY